MEPALQVRFVDIAVLVEQCVQAKKVSKTGGQKRARSYGVKSESLVSPSAVPCGCFVVRHELVADVIPHPAEVIFEKQPSKALHAFPAVGQ